MMSPHMEERFDAVLRALSEIRPYLIAAGGDVKLVSVEDDGVVNVNLVGSFTSLCRPKRAVLETVEDSLKSRLFWVDRVVAICPPAGQEAR